MLVKLLDCIEVISGGTPKTAIKEYWNGDIPWLTIDDFRDANKYVYKTQKSITIEGLENSSTNLLHKNDMIISARGTVGKLALIYRDMAFNQSCFGIRVKDKYLLNPEYLFYYLKCNLPYILKKSQGAIFDSINLNSFKYIDIILPNIDTQNKISSILRKLDSQIERNNAMIKKLQVLGKAIYSKNLSQINYINLSECSTIITGKEDANHASIDGKFNFFTCSDNTLKCDDYKFDGKNILVAGNGNFNVKYYDGKFNAYQRTYIIKNDEIFGNLYYSLLFNTEVFKKKSNGSIIKFITIDMLSKIDVPIFSNEINLILNIIVSQINSINISIENLVALKNILLPLLINQQLS